MIDLEQVRRLVRSKTFNVLERVEQLDGPTQVEIEHLDAAIKYLGKMWEDCKTEFTDKPAGQQAPRPPTARSADEGQKHNQ